MLPTLREDFGNPSSSTHVFGWRAEAAVDEVGSRLRPVAILVSVGVMLRR